MLLISAGFHIEIYRFCKYIKKNFLIVDFVLTISLSLVRRYSQSRLHSITGNNECHR